MKNTLKGTMQGRMSIFGGPRISLAQTIQIHKWKDHRRPTIWKTQQKSIWVLLHIQTSPGLILFSGNLLKTKGTSG